MGALTFTPASGSNADKKHGKTTTPTSRQVVRGTITFSASYANPAGDTLALGPVGLREVREILVDPTMSTGNPGLSIRLGGTPTAPTVRAFDATDTEVANTTNLSTRIVGVWLLGHA